MNDDPELQVLSPTELDNLGLFIIEMVANDHISTFAVVCTSKAAAELVISILLNNGSLYFYTGSILRSYELKPGSAKVGTVDLLNVRPGYGTWR